VDLDDCCVHAEFEAVLVSAEFDENEWSLTWDNGVKTRSFPVNPETMYKEVS